jgi:rod shape-determining protein MreD
MRRTLIDIGISLFILLIQTTLVPQFAIGTSVPDLLLIWIVYLGITRGHGPATVTGFLIGLVFDILSGPQSMLGLSSLAKSVAGFVAGFALNENKTEHTLGSITFLLIVFAASLVHNLLYFVIFLQGTDFSWNSAMLFYGLPAAIYTTAVGLIPMFVFARKYRV